MTFAPPATSSSAAQRLQDEVRTLGLENSRLTDQNASLKEGVAVKTREVEELKEANHQLQTEIQSLRKQLAEAAKTLKTKEEAEAARAKLLNAAGNSEKSEARRRAEEAKAEKERAAAEAKRQREAAKAAEEAKQAAAAESTAREEIAREEEQGLCTFTLLQADAIRNGGDDALASYSQLQSRADASSILVRRTLPKVEAYRGAFTNEILCVCQYVHASHPNAPSRIPTLACAPCPC